jgi:hypothetical protein
MKGVLPMPTLDIILPDGFDMEAEDYKVMRTNLENALLSPDAEKFQFINLLIPDKYVTEENLADFTEHFPKAMELVRKIIEENFDDVDVIASAFKFSRPDIPGLVYTAEGVVGHEYEDENELKAHLTEIVTTAREERSKANTRKEILS